MGWMNHKDGTFTADMSELSHHKKDTGKDVRCPGCRTNVNLTKFDAKRDRDNDVKEWDYKCPCGAKMRIFNENMMKPTFKQFLLSEAKKNPFQVRVETPGIATGDWQDVHMFADSLDDIAKAVGASAVDKDAHDRFDLSQLTTFVHKWIGDSPDNQRQHGGWDEMDMDVKSHSDDVLKVSFTFSGWNDRRKEEVKKRGVITIMPGNEPEPQEDPMRKARNAAEAGRGPSERDFRK